MINSRRELHTLMEKTINKNLQSLEERGEMADYAVKTNIIEANCGLNDIPTEFGEYQLEIQPTEDKFLYNIVVKKADEEPFLLYLDTFFERFWKLYSIEERTTILRFIEHFTNNLLKIDSIWMPHQMLDILGKDYKNVGFSIKFKQEVLKEDDLLDEDISQLTMRLWSRGAEPSKKIVSLLEENKFPTTKTSTRLLNFKDGEVKFLDEVYYDGKVTLAKGTEIDEHIHFIDTIIDGYKEKMIKIESNRMSLKPENNGFYPKGNPFEIKFSRKINIERVAEKIMGANKPFRLWGFIHDENDDFLRICGVDTHTGDKFDMDMMPDYARICLPSGACGNMIFRLYTNIQQSMDPGVIIYDEHGSIF